MSDPLSVAASIIAILQLTARVTQYLNDVKNGSEDRMRLRDEIRSTVCLLEMLKDRVEDADSRNNWWTSLQWLDVPKGPLEQFKKALELLVAKLAPASRIRQISQKIKWPFDKADVDRILGTIERQKSLFSLALQNNHIELSREIRDEIHELHKGVTELQIGQKFQENRIQNQESQEILAWISSLRFWAKQSDVFNRRQEGTCEWLFETAEFRSWLKGIERTLWCPGIPGAGKTVLASTVIDHLQHVFPNQDIGIAFIYCNYKEEKEQTVINLIGSLLRQLIERRTIMPDEVRALYKQHSERETRPVLAEYSRMLQLVINQFSKVYLVIDALDECRETDGTRSSLITEIRKLPTRVQFLCTSRHLLDIEQNFNNSPRLEIRASNADLERYLEGCIEQYGRLKKHVIADPSLLSVITKTIAEKVDGIFLLAQLHIESLSKKHDRKALRSALKNLPKELEDTYHEVLQRIYSQDKDDILLAERVLSWISFAIRPLTVREVQHAIATQNLEPNESCLDEEGLPDEDLLVAVCAGIVTIERERGVIRLVHYTLQQYFERIRKTRFPHAQTDIAKSCLTYLSFDTFTDGYCSSDQKLEIRFQTNPLFQYAAQHWGDHARESSDKELQDQILGFLDKDSRVSCCAQAMKLPEYRQDGYSQAPPEMVPGLWVIAAFGLEEVVNLLLKNEVDIQAKASNGEAALHVAASNGHMTVLHLLLENKADIESKTSNGETAIHIAARNGHTAAVQLLLEKEANIDAKASHGETALHSAVWNNCKEVAQLLLEKGADVETKNKYGLTVLCWAAADGDKELVQLLLDYKADIEAKSFQGETALYIAASNGREKVVQLLLEKEGNIESKALEGETALIIAAENGHEAVVRLLLKYKADVRATNDYGETALYVAAESWYEAVVLLLLGHCKENGIQGLQDDIERATVLLTGSYSRIACNACETDIPNLDFHYHCEICAAGDFDLCEDCVSKGVLCSPEAHHLIKRRVSGEEIIEVTA